MIIYLFYQKGNTSVKEPCAHHKVKVKENMRNLPNYSQQVDIYEKKELRKSFEKD